MLRELVECRNRRHHHTAVGAEAENMKYVYACRHPTMLHYQLKSHFFTNINLSRRIIFSPPSLLISCIRCGFTKKKCEFCWFDATCNKVIKNNLAKLLNCMRRASPTSHRGHRRHHDKRMIQFPCVIQFRTPSIILPAGNSQIKRLSTLSICSREMRLSNL